MTHRLISLHPTPPSPTLQLATYQYPEMRLIKSESLTMAGGNESFASSALVRVPGTLSPQAWLDRLTKGKKSKDEVIVPGVHIDFEFERAKAAKELEEEARVASTQRARLPPGSYKY